MMARDPQMAALVMLTDADGRILQVVRDDFGVAGQFSPDHGLALAVDRGSFAKALSFMAEMRTHGGAFDWELNMPIAGQITALHFAGAAAGDQWLILAVPSSDGILTVCDDLAGSSDGAVEAACAALGAFAQPAYDRVESGVGLYDEISRLNNELINLRRDLEKRVQQRTAELRASETRFRALFEQADVGIMLVDLDGRVLDSNPALQAILGMGDDARRGHTVADLFSGSKQGSGAADWHADLVAGRRENYRKELRYERRDGQTAWLDLTASVVRGADGEPLFALHLVQDITERKQTQAALLQAERLTIAGKLAASLAHEINNPMQSVLGFLGLAEETFAAGGDVSRYLDLALKELRRVARIVSRLRNLHRPSRLEEKRPSDVNELLARVMSLTHKRCSDQGVECFWKPEPDLPPLALVPDRIQQVFLNLVLNALDAMPDGGHLQVTATRTEEPLGVRISFRDDGMGIAEDSLPRVFEPFHSTKRDGLGLGLFISQDIVQQHGGRMDVHSTVGEGTEFNIWLPA